MFWVELMILDFRLISSMAYIPHLLMLQEGFNYLKVSFKNKNENCDMIVQRLVNFPFLSMAMTNTTALNLTFQNPLA